MNLIDPQIDISYDIECFPNFFSVYFRNLVTGTCWFFEISEWVDDSTILYQFLATLMHLDVRQVGYNNEAYDYILIHLIIQSRGVINYNQLYIKSQSIFEDDTRYAHFIWPDQRYLRQLDLLKIHHFDSVSKYTSLKIVEFNMLSDKVEGLPFKPGTILNADQVIVMRTYNSHDVDETSKFYFYSLPQIRFRDQLSEIYNKDLTNCNDIKIGKEYITTELSKKGIKVHKSIQSRRESINLSEVLLPYIKLEHINFYIILKVFQNTIMDKKDERGFLMLKGFFKNLTTEVNGFVFSFGSGGLHSSIKNTIIRSSDTHVILDWDVKSYYPNISIKNRFYPEHLGEGYCDVYSDVYEQRTTFAKSTPENAMMKQALVGAYGESNAEHSPFHDPKYMMSITVNGQLLLCMLAEQLIKIPDLTMIQANTDGITFLCPKLYLEQVKSIWEWWEKITKLELEEVEYSMMAIRDVNSYLAVKSDGKVKRIGCYAHETAKQNPATREIPWHKDHSSLIIAKAAEAALVNNVNISEFIRSHSNKYDFMIRTKVPNNSRLVLRTVIKWDDRVLCNSTKIIQNVTRYIVSKTGGSLIKVMPVTPSQKHKWLRGDHYQHENTGEYQVVSSGKKPKSGKFKPVSNKKEIKDREIGITVGWLVKDCSCIENFKWDDLNYEYYIQETHKIVDCLLLGSAS